MHISSYAIEVIIKKNKEDIYMREFAGFNKNNSISRKEWTRNWKEVVMWGHYFDYEVDDVLPVVSYYCKDNGLNFKENGGWIYVESNRYHYNRLLDLCYEILGEEDED